MFYSYIALSVKLLYSRRFGKGCVRRAGRTGSAAATRGAATVKLQSCIAGACNFACARLLRRSLKPWKNGLLSARRRTSPPCLGRIRKLYCTRGGTARCFFSLRESIFFCTTVQIFGETFASTEIILPVFCLLHLAYPSKHFHSLIRDFLVTTQFLQLWVGHGHERTKK